MKTEKAKESCVKEQLILAGLKEIELHGLADFSIRRVAKACELSCAAPYKHFADKREFILEIIDYVNQRWLQRATAVIERFPDNTRKQLVELSMEYIYFLLENPHFRAIMMLLDDSPEAEQIVEVSSTTSRLIKRYCANVAMPENVELRKTFVVRSLIYGAALMLDNGQLPREESSFRFISEAIDREFDLP